MGATQGRPTGDAGLSLAVDTGGKTGRLVLAALKLHRVPAEVWRHGERLRLLDLSNNALSELGSQIGALPKLQTLKLSFNQLSELPPELYGLDELKVLQVDHNRLTTVAAMLPRKKLRTLDLSWNAFHGAVGHPSLALPPSVVTCDLSNNAITGFLPSFGFEALASLEELDLDNCRVEALPPAMGHCGKLACIKLRNNRVKTLPSELLLGTSLSRLHLEGNPTTLLHLATIEGWPAFLERRKGMLDKGISQGLHLDVLLCGLKE
jgi:leucine-rich repeat protein SHOC2